ncbi:hypothetical protein BDF22DRAFT_667190 [Syncephalis plumigaleata]|nr:hypothetical protein BDF22DRAFT_667190 [Syncephalis plumigaleata]
MSIATATDKSFLELDVRYVSPRAAKSIVAQCGKIKPTTETLQSVNAFLDELVAHCAQLLYDQRKAGAPFPIDVEQAKSVLGELIEPGPFYNELLSAAAVAVRHQLRTPKSPGPQSTYGGLTPSTINSAESLAQLLRARCLYYSTLGGDASSFQPAWESDIIDMQSAVFFATALEFIGMHALREGARVALHKERPLVRMQDTYNVLAADPSVGPMFQKTTVYRNLKAHVTPEPVPSLDTVVYGEPRTPYHRSISDDPSKRPSSMIKSTSSDRSDSDRIHSPANGHHTANHSEGSLSSSRERSRGSSDALSKQSGDGSEVWRVMGPTTLEFEDLLKGKDTIKVSLTPINVAPIRPRGAQKNNVSMLTGRRASIVPPRGDLSADEDADEQGTPRKRGETLYEFLNSTGPEDLLSNGASGNRAGVKKQVSHSAGLGSVREENNSSAAAAAAGRSNGARFSTISALMVANDEDLLPPGQKPRAKPKEESLAEFLRSSVNGSLTSSVSAGSALDNNSGSRHSLFTSCPDPHTVRSPVLPPPPPPKPVCEERGTQASEPVVVTEERGTSTPLRVTAELAVQTDEIIEPEPEPEPVVIVETAEIAIQTDPETVEPIVESVESVEESSVKEEEEAPKVILPPEQVPLPEPTEEERIDLLDTEEERETARREFESREETIRIPSAVLDLIREALPTLIESGDTATCMEFLEELLTSGKSVHLKHTETQTNLNGDSWLFQSATTTTAATSSNKLVGEVASQDTAVANNDTCITESLLTTTQSIIPLERRRSIG